MSNAAVYPLAEGRFINRFLETPLFEKREHFKKTVMTGKVNEWLKYGFSINDNPCRKEFIADKLSSKPSYPDMSGCAADVPFALDGKEVRISMHMPFGNVSVDHSGFWHVPTSLKSYHVTWLYSPQAGEMTFELSTCGGSTIWFDGVERVCFRPFTRNVMQNTRFSVPLREGLNEIVVCQEDLAERDTDYYFRLEALAPEGMYIRLPVREGVDVDNLQHTEAMLESACIHLDTKVEDIAGISFVNPKNETVSLEAWIDFGDITSIEDAVLDGGKDTFAAAPGENYIVLRAKEQLPPGFYSVILQTVTDGVVCRRKLGAQLTRRSMIEPPCLDMAGRKELLLTFAADEGPENAYRAVALFEQNKNPELANSILRRELPGIRQHRDCSDFYLIAHLYALMRHREKLEPDVIEMMEDAILTFRYWIDEPGNDVMWFFSENHALLFHACQYIAGGLFPDAVFEASGLTGRECVKKAARLLDGWFTDFENEFMTEWNSNAYLPIDATAFGFMLLMIGKGDPLYSRLLKAMDRIFLCVAMYALKNTYISSYGRSYEKQLKGNYTNGTASLLYLGYGIGCITSHTGSFVPLCLCDYEPPKEYVRYIHPEQGKSLFAMNNQGYEEHVNLTLYKTQHVLLSTANAFKPYQKGYQEHIVQAAIDALANCYVNHPGETHPFGSGRPSYWAGNAVLPLAMQWKDAAVIRYHIPETALVHFTHAYFPFEAFDRVLEGEKWICGEKDGGYIYLFANNGLRRKTTGAYKMEEMISDGLENCWVIRVGDRGAYESLEAFAAASACEVRAMTECSMTLYSPALGEWTLEDEPAVLKINGEAVPYAFEKGEGILTIE